MTGGVLGSLALGAGLGLIGLDPSGALVAAVALAAGARDRDAVVFGAIVLVGTIGFGAVLTVTVGERLARFDWTSLVPEAGLRAGLEAGAALLLAAWAGARIVRGTTASEPRTVGAGTLGLVATGVLFVGTAATDPSFAALVVLAGREASLSGVIVANATWTVVSQAPLFVLVLAVLQGRHHTTLATLRRLRDRWAPRMRVTVTAGLGLAALVVLADVVTWAGRGSFLVGP